LLFAYGL